MRVNKSENKDISKLSTYVFTASLGSFFLSSLTISLGSLIDGFVIGRTMDDVATGACSLVNPLCFIIALIGGLLSSGFQRPCSKLIAKGDADGARRIFSLSFFTGLIISLVLMIIMTVFSNQTTALLGVRPGTEIFEYCKKYMIGTVLGIPAVTSMTILSTASQMDGERKLPVISVAVMTITNILGDILGAMFLNIDLFQMAAITSLSYYAGAIVLLTHFFKKDILLRPTIKGLEIKKLITIIKQGTPMGICRISTAWKGMFINHALAVGVTTAGLSAYYVQVQLNYLTNAFFMGVAQSFVLLVCLFYSEEDRTKLRMVSKIAIKYEVFIGFIISALIFIFADKIIWFYQSKSLNDEVLALGRVALRCFAVSLIAQGIIVLYANYLQSTGHVVMSNVIYVMHDVVITGLVVTICLHMNVSARADDILIERVFFGMALASVIGVTLLPVAAIIINRKVSLKLDSLLLLNDDFGVAPENEMNASPRSMEEVVVLAQNIRSFCLERGISKKNAYNISLATEEMAANVIKFGFEDNPRHILEVRLVKKGDELILRLRDNCRFFDPMDFYKRVFKNEDPTAMLGIQIVMKTASDVRYTSVLKLNNLTIRE